MRDMMNNVHPVVAIDPQSPTAATAIVGNIIDRLGYNSVTFAILLGTLAAAAITGTVLIEEGDDSGLSDAAAVADADLVGTEALAGYTQTADGETRKIGYLGTKRYVRMTVTPTSNNASMPIACVALLGNPNVAPTTNPPA